MTPSTPRYLLATPEADDGPCQLIDMHADPPAVLLEGTSAECARLLAELTAPAWGD